MTSNEKADKQTFHALVIDYSKLIKDSKSYESVFILLWKMCVCECILLIFIVIYLNGKSEKHSIFFLNKSQFNSVLWLFECDSYGTFAANNN